MRLHPAFLAAGLLLSGCTSYAEQERAAADLAAVRAITMAGPALSWEEMDIHPQLMARPCAVDTLVNGNGTVVGYCQAGRNCRTMDWRPIEAACHPGQPAIASRSSMGGLAGGSSASRGSAPTFSAPAFSPATPPLARPAMRVSF